MDEKYYIAINENERKGPYSIEELRLLITPETLVWHKNLPTWQSAKEVPELKSILNIQQDEEVTTNSDFDPPQSWILSALLTFFLFSTVLGAVAIYYAAKVDDAYLRGEHSLSKKYAQLARKFVFIGIPVGMIVRTVIIRIYFS